MSKEGTADMKKSVAVIGLGAIGSMALLSLARRGVDVVGFEQSAPGHDNAAYGGASRQYSAGAVREQDVALGHKAMQLWNQMESESGTELRIRAGQLTVGPALDPDVRSRLDSLRHHGLEHEVLTPDEMEERFPHHVLDRDEIGVYTTDGGVLRSNAGVRVAVDLAVRNGGRVQSEECVLSVEYGRGGVEVKTNLGNYQFQHALVTSGPWVGELIPELRGRVVAREVVSYWVRPTDECLAFTPLQFPPGVRRSVHGYSFTFLPAVDRREVKIVYWIPMRPEVDNPRHFRATEGEATRASACEAFTATLRGLSSNVSASRSYMEGFTPDRIPIVGRLSSAVSVLTGFSGTGFKIAPIMGEVGADLALIGTTQHEVGHMSYERFSAA